MKIDCFDIGTNGAKLTSYILPYIENMKNSRNRPAVLIFPGGGYVHVSPREGEPIALAYAAKGFNAFVLEYSVGGKGVFPAPQIEAMQALALIRSNASGFRIDPDRVAVVGFSAGGHLAASICVHCGNPSLIEAARVDAREVVPNAAVLVYPCITAKEKWRYEGIVSVHGKGLSDKDLAQLSCEEYVSGLTPPAFICHTSDDSVVNVMNPLLYAEKLAEYKVPFELKIYMRGVHGFSLGTEAFFPDLEQMKGKSGYSFIDKPNAISDFWENMRNVSGWFEDSVKFLERHYATRDLLP